MDARTNQNEASGDLFPLNHLRSEVSWTSLGNTIQQLIWIGPEYAVYRSDEGIYVHFSDFPQEEKQQRSRFTEICPELCELRYLTAQMREPWWA